MRKREELIEDFWRWRSNSEITDKEIIEGLLRSCDLNELECITDSMKWEGYESPLENFSNED